MRRAAGSPVAGGWRLVAGDRLASRAWRWTAFSSVLGGVEVQRVAEFVGLRRADGFDARRLVARVVAALAALAERSQHVAQRPVPEKVERLVGHLEGDARLLGAVAPSLSPLPPLALGVEVGRHGDVAFPGHTLDDLLDQSLEQRPRVVLIGIGRIAEQPLDRFVRQAAAVEQCVENRVVQRLQRPVGLVRLARMPEAAGEEHIRRASTAGLRDPTRRSARRRTSCSDIS